MHLLVSMTIGRVKSRSYRCDDDCHPTRAVIFPPEQVIRFCSAINRQNYVTEVYSRSETKRHYSVANPRQCLVTLLIGSSGFYNSGVKEFRDSLVAQMVKRLPTKQEAWVRSLGGEDPLEKEMATHSSTLA